MKLSNYAGHCEGRGEVQGAAQDGWELRSGPQAEASLICPSSSGASIQRQVWERHGGHPLKATCFLAHLSMYILMDSLPCVLVSRSHFDGKPQQWLRQRSLGWAGLPLDVVGGSLWLPQIW